MKKPAVPNFIDRQYIYSCARDCTLYIEGQGPWWQNESCLSHPAALRLIHLFRLCVELWQEREQKAGLNRRRIEPNNLFNLYPLIQHFSFTINQLAITDQSLLQPETIKSINQSCEMIQDFLKEWHDVDVEQRLPQLMEVANS